MCAHLVAHVNIVCVAYVMDEARAPKSAHCILHQMMRKKQGRGSVQAAHTQEGCGYISRPLHNLSRAYLTQKESDSMEQTTSKKLRSASNPRPPENSLCGSRFMHRGHLCRGRAKDLLTSGLAFITHIFLTLCTWGGA